MGNKIDRRDFLSLMGLGGAAAVTVGCGDSPNFDETWHPWVEPVEGTIPYIPNFYATTTHESDGLGLRVRTIEGRATLIHGNPEHPFSHGDKKGVGTITARQQSVIESLYGPGRVRKPRTKDGKEITWLQVRALVEGKLKEAQGKGVYALTGAFSGATAEFWTRFTTEMGTGKVVRYKPYANADMATASEKVFGRAEIPLVSLEGTDAILSLGAQFLETWGNVTDNMKHYADARTVKEGKRAIHCQLEPRSSMTGANADHRVLITPGTETQIAVALLKAVAAKSTKMDAATQAQVAGLVASVSGDAGIPAEQLDHIVETLLHAQSAVVLPAESLSLGNQSVAHYAAVLLLNKALGGIGKHYNYEAAIPAERVTSHQEIVDLIAALNGDSVDLLVVRGANPAYSLAPSLGFKDAVAKAKFTIALADTMDETAALADLILPTNHDLESWGEVATYKGINMLMQPVMQARWETKQAEDHLLEWLGIVKPGVIAETSFQDVLKASWTTRFGADWRGALVKGGAFSLAAGTDLAVTAAADLFSGVSAISAGDMPLVLVDSARFGDGFAANRGWMQELPEAMTGVTWDSWLEMSPATAKKLGVDYGDELEVTVGSNTAVVPAFLIETIGDNVLALATGQGHTALSEEYNRGVNAFAFLAGELNSGVFSAGPLAATTKKTGGKRKMATPHLPSWGDRKTTPLHNMDGSWDEPDPHYTRTLHQTVGLAELSGHGHGGHGGGHHFDEAMLKEESMFPRHKTRMAEEYRGFYPNRDDDKVYKDRDETFYDPYKWEMAVDLNRCTGCGSCVTACYGENNLPVVGRDQVIRGREMSWLRINRYLSFTKEGAVSEIAMMPMMCQQCGNAPCESVCPSLATYHSKDGLNAMIYNRCVGTRYCSNNCSYKVRRFNWFSWDFPGDMRWQMNPAVSVRQKGVMEKCTFCSQRIREANSVARDQGRIITDGEVKTACQEACPAQAISFGNIKDTASQLAAVVKEKTRTYKALDDHLQTKPGVTYLKRVTLDAEHHG